MKNINKQEELVSALWDFAKGLQKSTNKIVSSTDEDGYKTYMDLEVIGEAMERIAKIFNLEIKSIQ
jgi:uncharacterized protein with HEPN domain